MAISFNNRTEQLLAKAIGDNQAVELLSLIASAVDTAVSAGVAGAVSTSVDSTLADGVDLAVGSTSGTKIGTATTQKLGFFDATPVVHAAVTDDILETLQALGFIAAGAGDTPLNLTGGQITCGAIAMGDGANLQLQETTGTKIGTAVSQKLGFFNATPIVQPAHANQADITLDVDLTGADTVDKAALDTNFGSIQTLISELRAVLVNLGLMKGAA